MGHSYALWCKLYVCEHYPDLSALAAEWLVTRLASILSAKGGALLVPSAGRTPVGMYEHICRNYRDAIDWSRVVVFQMDEYEFGSAGNPTCFSNALRKQLVLPLGIKYAHFLSDEAGNPTGNPLAHEEAIDRLGGIDVAVFGVGRNGHLGFNEPGTPFDAVSGHVELHQDTLLANASSTDASDLPRHGLTLGLRVLRDAKTALVIATDKSKLRAVQTMLWGRPTTAWPVTALQGHPDVTVMVTESAFSQPPLL